MLSSYQWRWRAESKGSVAVHKMNHSSSLGCSRFAALSVAAVLIQLVGLFLFVFGFFPVKPALSGIRYFTMYLPPYCVRVHHSKPNFGGSVAPVFLLTRIMGVSSFGISVQWDREFPCSMGRYGREPDRALSASLSGPSALSG